MSTTGFANVSGGAKTEIDVDSGSDYGSDDWDSDTTSLSSSVYNHVYENGRRYHAYREGNYLMPNDETEQDRLDLVHHIYGLLLDGKLLIAPIEKPQRVLDLGTGTGIWAISFADEYPSAEVVGIDLSPIQPSWIPPNLKFELDDFEAPWQYAPNSFDLVHARSLAGCVADWPNLFAKTFKSLKPGGIFEVQDGVMAHLCDDDTMKGTTHEKINELVAQASEKIGKPMNVAHLYKQWMIDAGFVDVVEKIYFLPTGTWPRERKLKEIGRIQMVQHHDAMEPICLALFTRVLKMPVEEVMQIISGVKAEIQSRKIHCYTKLYFIYGRKPEH